MFYAVTAGLGVTHLPCVHSLSAAVNLSRPFTVWARVGVPQKDAGMWVPARGPITLYRWVVDFALIPP